MGSPCAGHRPRARSWLQGSHLPVPLHLLQGVGSGCAHFSELIVLCQDPLKGMDASICAEGCRKGALIPPGAPKRIPVGSALSPLPPPCPSEKPQGGGISFFFPSKTGLKGEGK